MPHANTEGGRRPDGHTDDGIRQNLTIEEDVGHLHVLVVAGTATDKRHAGPDDAVRAAHDLLLVACQPVGQQQQDAVRAVVEKDDRFCYLRAGSAQPIAHVLGDGGDHREVIATEGGHDDGPIARTVGPDLAGSRAADDGHVGVDRNPQVSAQGGQIKFGRRKKDDECWGSTARASLRARLPMVASGHCRPCASSAEARPTPIQRLAEAAVSASETSVKESMPTLSARSGEN